LLPPSSLGVYGKCREFVINFFFTPLAIADGERDKTEAFVRSQTMKGKDNLKFLKLRFVLELELIRKENKRR
jgi:hypothetical protein